MMQLEVQKQLNSAAGTMLLDVNLQLEKGQLIGLYGKSGAGKTSLLRIIAGLFEADKAYIAFGEQTWVNTQNRLHLRSQDRKIGFVFQDYALFPNMTVRKNLEFALRKGQDQSIIDELISINELGQLQGQYPATLSGGQQQRVALARSLVQRPQLLLLDEPLSAVDQEMRQKLRNHLLLLHRRFALTTILISHDQQELEQMADQVIILDAGKVLKAGKPGEVFPPETDNKLGLISGTITTIEPGQDGTWVALNSGNRFLKVWIETTQAHSLKKGQHVRVKAVTNGWEIEGK